MADNRILNDIYTTEDVLGRVRPDSAVSRPMRTLADALRTFAAGPEDVPTKGKLVPFLANAGAGGLNTAANWLDRRPEIGPDMLAPLGVAALNPMSRVAEGAVAQGATLSKNAHRWPWSPNDAFKYRIMKDGDRIGTAEGRVNGTEAYIRWLEREDAASPLGLADIRQLHQQFKTEWPAVTAYRGHRGSGALAGRENNTQVVRMEPRSPEVAEILQRRGLLADTPRASLPGTLVNGPEQPPDDLASLLERYGLPR